MHKCCMPLHMDARLSCANFVYSDELDEEFDTFPTSRSPDIVRMRYDRLRSLAGRIQTVLGGHGISGRKNTFAAELARSSGYCQFYCILFVGSSAPVCDSFQSYSDYVRSLFFASPEIQRPHALGSSQLLQEAASFIRSDTVEKKCFTFFSVDFQSPDCMYIGVC